MVSLREELVVDVQLLLGADAHECFDIPLLERTEHVIDFLHGCFLGMGEPTEPPSRESDFRTRVTRKSRFLPTVGVGELGAASARSGVEFSTSVSTAVVRHEVVNNRLSIGWPDWRTKCRNHLVHLGFPTLTVEKRRVDTQII